MPCECGKCTWCLPGAKSELDRAAYTSTSFEDSMKPLDDLVQGRRQLVVKSVDYHVEQSEPTPNDHPFIKDLVIKDMEYRAELGKNRYGTYLQPFNGRKAFRDAYEEALDLVQYLRQKMYEEEGK